MVERIIAEITRKRIRRGAFNSVDELKSAIMDYPENHNADPKPLVWTISGGETLEKFANAEQALESRHYALSIPPMDRYSMRYLRLLIKERRYWRLSTMSRSMSLRDIPIASPIRPSSP
jgi:hypothetical protein